MNVERTAGLVTIGMAMVAGALWLLLSQDRQWGPDAAPHESPWPKTADMGPETDIEVLWREKERRLKSSPHQKILQDGLDRINERIAALKSRYPKHLALLPKVYRNERFISYINNPELFGFVIHANWKADEYFVSNTIYRRQDEVRDSGWMIDWVDEASWFGYGKDTVMIPGEASIGIGYNYEDEAGQKLMGEILAILQEEADRMAPLLQPSIAAEGTASLPDWIKYKNSLLVKDSKTATP